MSEAFHFVMLEFMVIDGRASQSSLTVSLLVSTREEVNHLVIFAHIYPSR